MESTNHLIIRCLILLLLIVCNAFFASSEMAIVTVNDQKIDKLARGGNKRAKILSKLLENPGRFLSTVQVGVTLSGFLASAVAADSFAEILTAWFVSVYPRVSAELTHNVTVVILTLLLSYITLIFGELVPKRFGMKYDTATALFAAPVLAFIAKVFRPFIYLLTLSSNGVLRLFGINPHEEENNVTEEEIRLMVDAGEERGVIPEDEKNMINNIFKFDDIAVERIMTHRTEVVAVNKDVTFDELVEIATNERFSRLPVYDETLDNIVGILHIRSLLSFLRDTSPEDFDLNKLIKEPHFVPQSKLANDLFRELQESKVHIAVVVDEYGGTAGIVTLEDLIEFVLGNIQDEYDDEEFEIQQSDENTYLIDGGADFEMVCELLELPFSEREVEEYDYDTIGGFVMGMLDKIPAEGDSFELKNVLFEVPEVDDKRIVRVKATKQVPTADETNADTKHFSK